MATKKKTKLRKAVDEICCMECRGQQHWCLLKEVIVSSHDDEFVRFLMQLKCLELYKYYESEREKQDIGWEQAWMRWVESGLAKKFADAYDPDKDPVKLFTEITKPS